MNFSRYYETDLVTTDNVFDAISVADYLILEPLYKMEFYAATLGVIREETNHISLPINREVERIIRVIANTDTYNEIFTNVFNFVKQDYDDNYPLFLSELLLGRYEQLKMDDMITVYTDYSRADVEGQSVYCHLKRPEGRKYFHVIHGHIQYMKAKERIDKEKNTAMQGLFKSVTTTVDAIPPPPPPSPEDQKFIADMFKKMLEDRLKFNSQQMKKDIEYGELTNSLKKKKKEDEEDDDDEEEEGMFDTFEISFTKGDDK